MKAKLKTAAEERRSHLAIQARRDAVARLKLGETVTVRLANGDRVRARGLFKDEWPVYFLCLAVINRRLTADWCQDRNGLRVGPRHVSTEEIYGVVLQVNGKDPYEGSRIKPLTHQSNP